MWNLGSEGTQGKAYLFLDIKATLLLSYRLSCWVSLSGSTPLREGGREGERAGGCPSREGGWGRWTKVVVGGGGGDCRCALPHAASST